MTGQAMDYLWALLTDADGTRRDGWGYVGAAKAGAWCHHLAFPPAASIGLVAETAARWDADGCDAYVRMGLLSGHPGPGRRGGDALAAGLVALTADIDVAGPGHATAASSGLPLPPTDAEALAIIDSHPEPTFVVRSGGGFHAAWILGDHARLDGGAVKQLCRRWAGGIVAAGRVRGWHVDLTADASRVLRLPGTTNHKYDPPRPVTIVHEGPRHDLTTLIAAMPPAPPVAPPRAPAPILRSPGGVDAAEVTRRWSDATPWRDLLPDGWTVARDRGDGEIQWTRPGKDHGVSAVSHEDPPVIHVFTSSTSLPACADPPLTKLRVLAHLHYGGDEGAAWRAIAPPPDLARLAAFVGDGEPAKAAGRLRWALTQIDTGRAGDVRTILTAAARVGVPERHAAHILAALIPTETS